MVEIVFQGIKKKCFVQILQTKVSLILILCIKLFVTTVICTTDWLTSFVIALLFTKIEKLHNTDIKNSSVIIANIRNEFPSVELFHH
jgi:hypothetical protein